MTERPGVWVVRGGDYNELAAQLESKGHVAVGWPDVPDISNILTRNDLKEFLESVSPRAATPNSVGQLFRFVHDINPGDFILTPEKATSSIHITRCAGAYSYNPTVFSDIYPHVRPVTYLKRVPRKPTFPQSVRNTLGSVLTVFRADSALPYIMQALGESPTLPDVSEATERQESELWADEIEAQAKGQILEAFDDIDHYEFQEFVAGLLEALGYRAKVGGRGADGGVDILAYKDVFGLESPRIKAQTKNQKSAAGIADVGYLNGVLAQNESGLFVCTGGFTKDALNAAFVRSGRVALVDGGFLLELVVNSYHKIPESARKLLPLRSIYVPERSPD